MSSAASPANVGTSIFYNNFLILIFQHIKQKDIASFFSKRVSESPGTTPAANNVTSHPMESNVSKLTPVNKTLFHGSATKKRSRTLKAKLPPSVISSERPMLSTGSASHDIITIVDEDSKQVSNLASVIEDVAVVVTVDSEPLPVNVDPTLEAVSCTVDYSSEEQKIEELSKPEGPVEAPPVEVGKKKRPQKPRARKPTAEKKTQSDTTGREGGDDDLPVIGAVTVTDKETPACDGGGGAEYGDRDVSKEEKGEGGESGSVSVSGARKRRRTAKALALLAQEQSDVTDEAPPAPLPLPADVRLRLELLEGRREGALADALVAQR